MSGVYAEAVGYLRPLAGEAGRSTIDRAVGLLAGRAGCRLAEAHRHLLRTAAERHQEVAEVAASVLRLLDTAESTRPESLPRLVSAAVAGTPPVTAARRFESRKGAEPGGEAARIAGTERLGNLGWGEWDLVSGEIYWSPQLFRIYERDPLLGPLSREESDGLAVADDGPLRAAALDAFERQETVDITTRVRIGGRVKHLRTVADAVRDAAGLPLRVYGIVQDVTESEVGAQRLAQVERDLAAEHELARELQRIILPLPAGPIELPGLKVAVRYLPAGQESLVGGDWYQAVELRDGSVLLAVGDVAGHGTPAATTMAQLRHALRALSVTTGDPGVLLGHLNRLTCDLERETPELSATAVLARFDPVRREILWAQAGHPPPLLSRAGRTAPLGRPPGPVLGVVDDAVYPTARLDFRPGDLLLLYTDGLVENRRRSLDEGLATVIASIDDAVRAAPEQPLAQVLARLRQANPDDDTCILAARAATGETRDLRGYLATRR